MSNTKATKMHSVIYFKVTVCCKAYTRCSATYLELNKAFVQKLSVLAGVNTHRALGRITVGLVFFTIFGYVTNAVSNRFWNNNTVHYLFFIDVIHRL